MKPATKEWVDKAEADFICAQRESRARRQPSYDDICFHVQQCIEKYMKARLIEENRTFPKIHDLSKLLDLLLSLEALWADLRPTLIMISEYAVMYRYPGESATKTQALTAFRECKKIRAIMRIRLGLKP